MTPQDLNERIRSFGENALPAKLFMLFCALGFFVFVVAYLLDSPHPLLFWPIAVGIFGGAVLMSLVLPRLIARASIRANLLCPCCHALLGGYVK